MRESETRVTLSPSWCMYMRACGHIQGYRYTFTCATSTRHTDYKQRKLHPEERVRERQKRKGEIKWGERERACDTGSAARHSANFQPPPTRPPPNPSTHIPILTLSLSFCSISFSRVHQPPPTLPLLELVFAASTARSMGLLTRVGIYVRVPTAPGQFSPNPLAFLLHPSSIPHARTIPLIESSFTLSDASLQLFVQNDYKVLRDRCRGTRKLPMNWWIVFSL